MPSVYKMGGRKEVGWREGRELLRAAFGELGCFRNCQSEKVPDPPLHPQVWVPLPAARSPSFQPGSRGREVSRSQASPGLPSPAWPRARNPAPLQPRLGEIARQGATCQRTLGEQEGRTGAFCTLWPGCSFLPLSTHPQCAPFPDITRTPKPRHARVRPSHRPRSID